LIQNPFEMSSSYSVRLISTQNWYHTNEMNIVNGVLMIMIKAPLWVYEQMKIEMKSIRDEI